MGGYTESLNDMQNESQMINNESRNNLLAILINIVNKHQLIIHELQLVQKRVIDVELSKWKRAQKLEIEGEGLANILDRIQEWCEALAELIIDNKKQVKTVEYLCQNMYIMLSPDITKRLENHKELINNLLTHLVNDSFILEKQPSQVIKTMRNFTAIVRFLVGGKINFKSNPPQVRI